MEEQHLFERDIFYEALDVTDAAQRKALLDSRCDGDAALRQRIEDLLLAHDGNALHQPPKSFFAVDSAEFDLEPGQTIGRFRLLEKIGEGGFGVVYMADQLEPVQRRAQDHEGRPGHQRGDRSV